MTSQKNNSGRHPQGNDHKPLPTKEKVTNTMVNHNPTASNGKGFDIRDYVEKLTPAKEKGRYICPVCEDDNFTVNQKTGAYQCWSSGCDSAEIRQAVAPFTPQFQPIQSKRIPRKKSRKEKDRDAQLAAAEVEMQVDHLATMVVEGIETLEHAQLTLSAWCKEHGNNAYDAKNLLRAKVKAVDKQQSVEATLLDIAKTATYFHSPDKIPYADISINGHRATYKLTDRAFILWLVGQYFERREKGVSEQKLKEVLATLAAQAIHSGEERQVYLRIAKHEDSIYLDLGTPTWAAVKVDKNGWCIEPEPPVRFYRPNTLMPLPNPVKGASLNELRDILNVDKQAWVLTATYLLFCLWPEDPHPVLILHGEAGSGKSTIAEFLKILVDPGKAPLLKAIVDPRNQAVAAKSRWIIVYDNLSHINAELSDDICRMATGGGFSTRALHTDEEEAVFEFIRPQILTGIDSLATRGDLLERALMVSLPTIDESSRITREALNERMNKARPRILGALLTALSQTLKALPQTRPSKLPRMADYARFAIASESALGLEPGSFNEAYQGNREEAYAIDVESSPIASAIVRLMGLYENWQGTATDLLSQLEGMTEDREKRAKYWPSNVAHFGRLLRRVIPALRGIGIEISEARLGKNGSRTYLISRKEEFAVSHCQSPLKGS